MCSYEPYARFLDNSLPADYEVAWRVPIGQPIPPRRKTLLISAHHIVEKSELKV